MGFLCDEDAYVMKVIVNSLQCRSEYTGTGRYVRNICRELAQIAPGVEFIQLVGTDNAEAYSIPSPNFSQICLPIQISNRLWRIAFEQSVLPGCRPAVSWPGL